MNWRPAVADGNMANVLMTKYTKKPRKVKRKKAKPRIRKKKALTKKQRARAAKKGWKTRKRNEREMLKLIKLGKERNLVANPALQIVQIARVYQFVDKLKGALPGEKEQLWIDEQIREFAHEHMEDDDESVIRARLFAAEQNGTFDEELTRLAEEFDMSEREVYTIWISP